MIKSTNILERKRNEFKKFSFEEKLLIINSISLFIFPFFVIIPLLITVGFCLFKKDIRKNVFSVSHQVSFLVFAVLGFLAAIWSKNIPGIAGGVFLIFLVIFSYFSRAYMTRRLFEIITDNICYLSIFSFIVGVADYLIRFDPANSEHRTASTFFNANYYAFIIEFVILICLYKLTKYPYKWRIYLFIAFLNLAGILFCKTRSAIAAIFIGALFFFIFTKQYKLLALCLGIVLIIGVGIIVNPADFIPRFDSLIYSVTVRFDIWATAFKGLSYRPIFGQGLWAYMKIVEIKGGAEAMHAHSLWFDIFLSFGFVGTSFVSYYFANTLFSLKKQVHINAFYHEYSLIIALFVCALVHCTTDLAIVGVETSIIAMLLFGIVGNGKKLLLN